MSKKNYNLVYSSIRSYLRGLFTLFFIIGVYCLQLQIVDNEITFKMIFAVLIATFIFYCGLFTRIVFSRDSIWAEIGIRFKSGKFIGWKMPGTYHEWENLQLFLNGYFLEQFNFYESNDEPTLGKRILGWNQFAYTNKKEVFLAIYTYGKDTIKGDEDREQIRKYLIRKKLLKD